MFALLTHLCGAKTFCEKRKQLQNRKSRPSDQVSFVNNGVSLRKIRSVKNLLQNKFPTINGTLTAEIYQDIMSSRKFNTKGAYLQNQIAQANNTTLPRQMV